MLDKVYGNEELNTILNALDGSEEKVVETSEVSGELSRLQLAIECKEKKVGAPLMCS